MKTIYEIYAAKAGQFRDEAVFERIQAYMSRNMAVLSDGIVNHIPVIAASARDTMAAPYGITEDDWKEIQKSKEWTYMKGIATKLKLGLLCSYYDTHQKIFLVYLGVLIWSAKFQQFFNRGHDPRLMQYVLDSASNTMDFKKLNYSLLMVLNKKIDTYTNAYDKQFKMKKPDDKTLRLLLQAIQTRVNATIRNIATLYYKIFNSDELKLVTRYSRTKDGKVQFSPSTVFQIIREKTVDSLSSPSDAVLNGLGLSASNPRNLKFRVAVSMAVSSHFGELSRVVSGIIDNWVNTRPNKNISLKDFRQNFARYSLVARTLTKERKEIEEIAKSAIEEYNSRYNPKGPERIKLYILKQYLFRYVLGVIVIASGKL